VPDLQVAACAIHFPFGHMGIVHERYIFVFIQSFGLIMTDITPFLGSLAVSLNDIEVTLLAGDVAGTDKIQMVESEPLELNILSRELMAGGAIPQGKGSSLSLRGLEVAEITGALRHLNVCAHDDLGVAARAAQLFTPPQVAEMEPVIEADSLLVGDLPRQDVRGMASRPQATGVFDLGVGFRAILSGHVLNHGIDGLEFDPDGRLGLRWIMTLHTGHLVVPGGLPGFVIGFHDVAAVAKRRAGAIVE
jgi:hypothetical protein